MGRLISPARCLFLREKRVILLRVSSVAELSGPDAEMNDDGEGDYVWVELLPVQLVDTHWAGFLDRDQQKINKKRKESMQRCEESCYRINIVSHKAAIIQSSSSSTKL